MRAERETKPTGFNTSTEFRPNPHLEASTCVSMVVRYFCKHFGTWLPGSIYGRIERHLDCFVRVFWGLIFLRSCLHRHPWIYSTKLTGMNPTYGNNWDEVFVGKVQHALDYRSNPGTKNQLKELPWVFCVFFPRLYFGKGCDTSKKPGISWKNIRLDGVSVLTVSVTSK